MSFESYECIEKVLKNRNVIRAEQCIKFVWKNWSKHVFLSIWLKYCPKKSAFGPS